VRGGGGLDKQPGNKKQTATISNDRTAALQSLRLHPQGIVTAGATMAAKALAGSLGELSNQVLHHEHVRSGWHSVVKVNQVFRQQANAAGGDI
jgi:hypothetical protein